MQMSFTLWLLCPVYRAIDSHSMGDWMDTSTGLYMFAKTHYLCIHVKFFHSVGERYSFSVDTESVHRPRMQSGVTVYNKNIEHRYPEGIMVKDERC
jgi:hypothetical protein